MGSEFYDRPERVDARKPISGTASNRRGLINVGLKPIREGRAMIASELALTAPEEG
jgi:hypothetical protein